MLLAGGPRAEKSLRAPTASVTPLTPSFPYDLLYKSKTTLVEEAKEQKTKDDYRGKKIKNIMIE